jgi:uncharacterized YccA/Bax inhibitor family protein
VQRNSELTNRNIGAHCGASSPIGIAVSLFVVTIAALNLVLDFDFIEQGVNQGAPEFMEWYGAFGIIVTLVWLYLEIIRLLTKLRGRNLIEACSSIAYV